MYRIVNVFAVYTTVDEYGRCGKRIGFFTDQGKAREAAKGQGWYGSEGNIVPCYAIEVDGQFYALEDPQPIVLDRNTVADDEKLRQSTLASLTPDQKRVLGLQS